MKKTRYRIISVLLSLCMVISCMVAVNVSAGAETAPYSGYVGTTTTVRFNNMDWYVIADNSTARNAGTVTLFAKDPIGSSLFNQRVNYNAYSSSVVKEYLDRQITGSGSFAEVADLIADTNLSDVGVTSAKLYLLSNVEVNALSVNIRKCSAASSPDYEYNQWWLRTPSTQSREGAYIVDGAEGFLQEDTGVQYIMRVRPALRLDLSKVAFTDSTRTFSRPVPAAADDIPFTFNDSGNYQGVSEYRFGSFAERWNNITKIEVLIDMEKITGWGGQVFYAKGTAESDRHSAMFDSTPGIKKYTAGEGTIEGVDFAGIQLVGMGRLLAYTVTFSEGDPITAGDWNIPEVTPPDAKTGLTATSTAQTLVTAGTVTGTGTLEYSLDNSTWSTELPTGTDAGDYTVYYRVRYGTSYYVPLYNGISVTIGAAPVAKVGETEYTDFAEALSSCSAGSPLTLIDDVTADSTITVTGTRAIDLNGHNINSSVQTAISVSSGAELTISGSGKISNLILNQGTLNFNDAEVSAITTQGGLTNINSGKISAPSSWTALNSNNNGHVNISGGTIYAKSWRCVHANNGTVNISGGIFQCSVAPLSTEGTGKIILSGGYFPEKISSATYTLADGYALVDSDDASKGAKMVSVPTPVAKVGETEYTDFKTALDNWSAGSTLTLLDDVTITSKQSQSNGATWVAGISVQGCQKTLDLNGHTMALSSDISVSQERVIEVVQSGSLTINDSSGTNAGKITGVSPSGDNGWSGALYINSGATVIMYGGTITGNVTTNGAGVWIDGRGHKGNAAFNMYDGVISGNTATNGGGVYVGCQLNEYAGTAQFNMYGGTITGNTATNGSNVYVDKGVLTHTGGTINGGLTDKSSRYVKVTFDANGASGTMSEQYVQKSTNTTAKENEFTNINIEFRGWNTAADGSGTAYANKSDLNVTADTTLYAQWLIPLADSFIQAIEDQTYTGEAIEPALTVKNGDTVLTADTDYTAEYSGNINAGTATVTITGIGIYTGTAQATFTIVPAVSSEISGSTGSTSVTVSGLEEEARAILEAEAGNSVNSVNVSMQVENASESSAEGSGSITDLAPDKKLTFYEIRVEKTIDSVKTLMSDTSNVLEIAVPYAYTGKQGVTAYRYHGNNAVALTQSDSRADGTFRVDEANGMVYIYANKFSTYAIGYTPYYSISGSAALAGYTGKVQAKLTASNGSIAADLGEVSLSELNFSNMTKGTYTLTLTWTDGKENNIMIPITLD